MINSINDHSYINKQFLIKWTPHKEYGLSVSIIDRDTKKKVAYATGGGYDKLQAALMEFFDKFLNMSTAQRAAIEVLAGNWNDKEHGIEELFKSLGFAGSYSDTVRYWQGKPAKNTYYFRILN